MESNLTTGESEHVDSLEASPMLVTSLAFPANQGNFY